MLSAVRGTVLATPHLTCRPHACLLLRTVPLTQAIELIVDNHWLDEVGGVDFHYVQSVGKIAAQRFEDEDLNLETGSAEGQG